MCNSFFRFGNFFSVILLKIFSMPLVWHSPFSVLISLRLCLLKVLQYSILFKKNIIHLYWAMQVFHLWHCCPHDPLYCLSFLLRFLFGLLIFLFSAWFQFGFSSASLPWLPHFPQLFAFILLKYFYIFSELFEHNYNLLNSTSGSSSKSFL